MRDPRFCRRRRRSTRQLSLRAAACLWKRQIQCIERQRPPPSAESRASKLMSHARFCVCERELERTGLKQRAIGETRRRHNNNNNSNNTPEDKTKALVSHRLCCSSLVRSPALWTRLGVTWSHLKSPSSRAHREQVSLARRCVCVLVRLRDSSGSRCSISSQCGLVLLCSHAERLPGQQ